MRATVRALLRRHRRWWWLPGASAFLALVGVLTANTVVAAFAGFGLVAVLRCYAIAPRRMWTRCEQREPQEYVFDQEGITAKLPNAESRTTWDYWTTVIRVGDSYVLRTTRGQAFLPRRAFDSPAAEERFRELARDRWSDEAIST